jgi:hypothetical protein
MKNNIILDSFDIELIKEIISQMKQAASEAEKTSKRVYGESIPAYEFGFLKGMINTYSEHLELIINK